jgi:hypothetical protein
MLRRRDTLNSCNRYATQPGGVLGPKTFHTRSLTPLLWYLALPLQVSPQRSTHSLERFTAESPWGAAQMPVVKLLSPRRLVTHSSQDGRLVRQLVEGSFSDRATHTGPNSGPTSPLGDGHKGAQQGGAAGDAAHFSRIKSEPAPARPPVGEGALSGLSPVNADALCGSLPGSPRSYLEREGTQNTVLSPTGSYYAGEPPVTTRSTISTLTSLRQSSYTARVPVKKRVSNLVPVIQDPFTDPWCMLN